MEFQYMATKFATFYQFEMGTWRINLFLAVAALIGEVVASPQQCGIAAVIPREYVAHGFSSALGQWPWHGALFHREDRNEPSKYACGVTVVSNFYTLTAAHCTFPELKNRNLQPKELLVRLGVANLEKAEHSNQQFAVTEIIRHEGYRSANLGNDIALLKVGHEIEFNNYVRPICFWKGDDSVAAIVGKNGYSPGWGLNEHGILAKGLKHAVMPIASREQCRQSDPDYYMHYLFDSKAFCASPRNGTSVSNGDSGGGLYIQVDNVWYLRGIVSNGKQDNGRLDTNNFIVYTDVAYYLPWIRQTLDITLSDLKFAECGIKNEKPSRRSQLNRRPWPWYGEVYRNGSKPQWAGDIAIINRKFVLSQAAIFTPSDYKDPFRLMVVFKASRNEAEIVLLQVQVKVIIPIRKWESPQKENNIAILELYKPLIFSEDIRPICLWRGSNAFSMIKNTTVHLGRATGNPLPGTDCSRYTNSKDAIANSLCFGTTKKEYVRMFSSSIMYLQYNGKWYARGISYGSAKSDQNYFIYLLDLPLYMRWIDQTIAERSEMLLPLSSCVTGSNQEWNVQLHTISNQCYGALVTSYLILTTAFCVTDFNRLDRSNILQVSNSVVKNEIVNVTEVFKHPFFHEYHLTHNIALVQIEKPFDADPICISTKPSYSGQLYFTTWQSSTALNQSLSLSDMNDCGRKWRNQEVFVNLEGGHICGQLNEPSSAFDCHEDLSGSPLSYRTGRKQFLQGILDFGKARHCTSGGLPMGFINVTFYSSWIYQTFETVRSQRGNLKQQDSPNDDVDQYENFNNVADTVLPQLRHFGDQLKMSIKDDGVRDLLKNVQNWFG